MKTLLLMRHAKSSWDDPSIPDHDRPLNKRGRTAAPKMGRLLRGLDLIPDIIVSSTALRALETAHAVAAECGYSGIIREDPSLYLSAADAYIAAVRRLGTRVERPLIIGHNPGVEDLLQLLTAVDLAIPTAAVARLETTAEVWADLDLVTRCQLEGFWKPKELPDP